MSQLNVDVIKHSGVVVLTEFLSNGNLPLILIPCMLTH